MTDAVRDGGRGERITILIPLALRNDLKALRLATGQSTGDLINQLLEAHISTPETAEEIEIGRRILDFQARHGTIPPEEVPEPEAPKVLKPRTVQQTLPMGRGELVQGLTRMLRRTLTGEWKSFARICKEIFEKDPYWTEAQIHDALRELVHCQEAERYPPIVRGRRPRKESCEYRLKEASE